MLNKAIKSVEVKARKRINIRKEFAEQNRLRKSFERKLRNQLNRYFKKYYNGIADLYEEELPYGQVIRDSQIDLTKILNSHYRQVITSFGERQLRVLEKQENRFESIYQDYVNLVGAERVVGITRSNQKIIQKVINANQDAGVAVVAKEIRASSEVPYTRYRSATIARTETHNAASYANQQTAQSMNIPDQQKQWVTTQDPRSRSTHLQANGQVVPLDEDFIVGGKPMKYPGDPRGGAGNVINCRCVLIYTSPEDVVTDDTTITPKPRQARDIPKPVEFSITDVIIARNLKGRDTPKDYDKKLLDGTNETQKKVMVNLPKPREIIGGGGYMRWGTHTLSSPLTRSTLVHEYGHHIDQQIGYLEKLGKTEAISKTKKGFDGSNLGFTQGNKELREAFEKDKDKLKFGKLTTVPKKDREEYKRQRDRNLKGFKDELFEIKLVPTTTTFRGVTKIKIKEEKVYKYKNSDSLSDLIDGMVKGDFRANYYTFGHAKKYWRKRTDRDLSETFANFFSAYADEGGRTFMQKYIPNTFKIMEKKLIEISNLPN